MSKESNIRQVSIRVDDDLYERYKAALRDKRPRETTTVNLQRHMWAVVEEHEKQLAEEKENDR